jgi:hypothetical protein
MSVIQNDKIVKKQKILESKVQESGKKRRLCALKRNAEAFRIDCISA